VWEQIKRTIRVVAQHTAHDPIKALCVSSLGEAVVPVTSDQRILDPGSRRSIEESISPRQRYLEECLDRSDLPGRPMDHGRSATGPNPNILAR
jgi:hypothetical protein